MKLRLPNKNIQPSIYEYRFNTSQYKPFSNPNTFQQFNSTHYPSPATTIQCSSNITPSTSFYNQTTFTSFPKTSSPFKLTQVHPFTPTLQEHHKLSTYYQTTETDEDKYYYNKHHKKHLSQEEKAAKRFLYRKYNINKYLPLETTKLSVHNTSGEYVDNKYPQVLPTLKDNNNVSIKVKRPFFKSINKARKAVSVNKQIATRLTEIGNCIQINKYHSNIETISHKQKILDTMPRVRIKKLNHPKTIEELKEEQQEENTRNVVKKKSVSLAAYLLSSFNNMNSSNVQQSTVPSLQSFANVKMEYSISIQFRAYKPTSRAFFSVNTYNNKLYLFGGLNSKYNNDMWCYSFNSKRWSLLKNYTSDAPVERYGHTAIIMEHYIVIYGGVPNDNYVRLPGDILLFNILTQSFSEPRLTSRIKPGNRKGHIAVGISQTMLIQGGMDIDTNEIQRSAFVYTLLKNCWNELEINIDDLPFLMYHTAVIVNDYSYSTIQPYSVYKPPNDLPHNRIKKVKNDGVYIFGGINKERKLCNDVYIIKVCRKPCKVVKPKIKGRPPSPRINAKMLYMNEYNLIIIHGGCGGDQEIMNDIAIINMETLNWVWPQIEAEDPGEDTKYLISRTEHEIFSNGGKIYILGGRDIEQYHKMDFEIVTFQIST